MARSYGHAGLSGISWLYETNRETVNDVRKEDNMAKELPKRSEVKVEDTWKVEDIYPTLADWEADLAKAEKLAEELAGYEGKLNTAENVYAAAKIEEEIDYIANRVFGYAARVSDVDTGNAENQKLIMTARTKFV